MFGYCIHEGLKCNHFLSKERKQIVKGLKGYFVKLSQEKSTFVYVVRVLDIVDDILLLKKTVLAEIQKSIGELITSKFGKYPLLHALVPHSKHFSGVKKHLQREITLPSEDGEETFSVSKKSIEDRHQELLDILS